MRRAPSSNPNDYRVASEDLPRHTNESDESYAERMDSAILIKMDLAFANYAKEIGHA